MALTQQLFKSLIIDPVAVLRSIAYDASLFERCTAAMISLALAEQMEDRSHKPIQQFLQELFHIIYSGTHATAELPRLHPGCLGIALVPTLLAAKILIVIHSSKQENLQ
jgi:hypothetical protein